MARVASIGSFRSGRARIWLQLSGILLLALTGSGCQAVILLGYLIGGPPSIEPDFEAKTKKSLAKKGIKTLVLCYAPKEVKWDNEAVDHELAKHVAYQLNGHKIKVIDPDRVNEWLDQHDDWDNPAEIGNVFDVDYIIFIDIKDYDLYEKTSNQLYRGKTEAILSVIEMEKRDKNDPDAQRKGNKIYSKEISSRFPTNVPVSVDQYSYSEFKKLYLSTLSEQIGVKFYESYAGDEIPNSAL